MTREPAMIVAAIVAVLAVLGIQVAPEQSDAVTAGVAAVVAIVGGLVTRSQVTPAGKACDDNAEHGVNVPGDELG